MKVKPFQIPKPLHKNLIVQVDKSSGFYEHLHQHDEIQLSLVVQGAGKLLVGDSIHVFHPGFFFGIDSNCPHVFKTEKSVDEVHMISIFFTEQTFGDSFFDLPDLSELRIFFESIKQGIGFTEPQKELITLMGKLPKASDLNRVILFLELLKLLGTLEKRSLSSFTYHKPTDLLAGERLQSVFDFALRNFQNEIKLEDVANLVHMTPNAFCRFFKQRTNKTFFRFLIELRVEHASHLLRNRKDLAIAEIAEHSGFNSISNFNRQFRSIKNKKPSSFI